MSKGDLKQFLLPVPIRILLPALASIFLFAVATFWIILPKVKATSLNQKREMIRELTHTVWGVLAQLHQDVQEGRLSEAEAQHQAIQLLQALRYGADGKDYFWINDLHPRMIMHPYRPDLNGKTVADYEDPNGKRLFVEVVRVVERQGEGYVDYMWQWKDDPTRIVPKLSYVKAFEPWGWIIGTGVYIEDVRDEIAWMTWRLTLLLLGVLALILCLSVYMIFQTFNLEKEKIRAQQELEKSERRLSSIVKSVPDIIYRLDPDGRITFVSEAVQRYGYNPQQLVGKSVFDLVHSEDLAKVQYRLNERRTGNRRTRSLEVRLLVRRQDSVPHEAALNDSGNDRVFLIEAEGLYRSDPPSVECFLGTQGAARDITERKRAEEADRQRKEQTIQHQAALLQLATRETSDPDANLRAICETSARTLAVERVSVWLLTENQAEVYCRNLFERSRNDHDPGTHLSVAHYSRYFEALQTRQTLAVENALDDPRTRELAETHLKSLGISSILNVAVRLHGKLAGIVCHEHLGRPRGWTLQEQEFARSVADKVSLALSDAERIRTENERETLRHLAQRLTEPLDMIQVGKVIAEETRRLFRYDAFGLSYFDEIKKDFVGIYFEDTPEGEPHPVECLPVELRIDRPGLFNEYGGESRTSSKPRIALGNPSRTARSVIFTPIRWAGKNIGQLVVQSYAPGQYQQRDLRLLETFANQCGGALIRVRAEEEQTLFQAQVQHAQKLESLGVLAGGIAHDFNNLLMSILGNANLAEMDLPAKSPARESLDQIEKAAERASELTNQLLAYSGKGKFVNQRINLNQLVEEMGHLLKVSISKKAHLQHRFASTLPTIEADPAQIRQIVMNLITNASEALGGQSGIITIATGALECDQAYLQDTYLAKDLPEGPYVYLEVTDTGCGMDKLTQGKIFDPFFTTKFTGRGLGLAAVIGIVRGHRGAIRVYSEPGQGTTFKVLLPACDQPGERSRIQEPPSGDWKGEGVVLVVDDEESIRQLTERLLKRFGLQVLTAEDGLQAVDVFRAHADEIDVILLDMMMPRMDGQETFQQIRKIKSDAQVILSSGYSEGEATTRFAGSGLAGFIQKPYRPIDLIAKLQNLLA